MNRPDSAGAKGEHFDRADGFAKLTEASMAQTFFDREFPDFAALDPDLTDLTDQIFANPTGKLATMRAIGWSLDDRIAVVGDAAHAIVLFHGQGMNLAMESAQALALQLEASPDDISAAFSAFEAERKPNADAISDMALENYIEMRAGVVDPDYVIKRAMALELERRHPDRLRPRYNMVMFLTMPYAEARERATRQTDVLSALTEGLSNIAEVDFERAARLVQGLDPLPALDPLAGQMP